VERLALSSFAGGNQDPGLIGGSALRGSSTSVGGGGVGGPGWMGAGLPPRHFFQSRDLEALLSHVKLFDHGLAISKPSLSLVQWTQGDKRSPVSVRGPPPAVLISSCLEAELRAVSGVASPPPTFRVIEGFQIFAAVAFHFLLLFETPAPHHRAQHELPVTHQWPKCHA
jgi:hypothetical protein